MRAVNCDASQNPKIYFPHPKLIPDSSKGNAKRMLWECIVWQHISISLDVGPRPAAMPSLHKIHFLHKTFYEIKTFVWRPNWRPSVVAVGHLVLNTLPCMKKKTAYVSLISVPRINFAINFDKKIEFLSGLNHFEGGIWTCLLQQWRLDATETRINLQHIFFVRNTFILCGQSALDILWSTFHHGRSKSMH